MSALLAPGETISDGRVSLGEASITDLEVLPWLDAALKPDWTPDDLIARVKAGDGLLISDADSDPVGLVVVRRDLPLPKTACVPFIAVEPARRYRGIGGTAGMALEKHLRDRLAIEAVYAPIPDGRGLAVYFWLRLGYRPLTQSESPGPLIGLTDASPHGIWMAREHP